MATEEIFISYRRADASAWAMWLERLLQERYGVDSVFRDMTRLRVGDRFEQEIHRVLAGCKAAIVMIGPSWLTVNGDSGVSRLFEPSDFVRREIERALERHDVSVIPVLVEGMRMPEARELPPGLQPLAGYQALDLSDARRNQDMELLFDALERAGLQPVVRVVDDTQPVTPAASYLPTLAAAAMTAAAVIGAVIAASPAAELGARRFPKGDVELPTRIAAYAAERAALWAVIGGLALVVACAVLNRGSWGHRIAGAIGMGAVGLVICAFAGAAGGAAWIVLDGPARMQDAYAINCIAVTLTGLVLAGAFARLTSAAARGYYLSAGLVGGLLAGALGASEAESGTAAAGVHALEALLMVGTFALALVGLAMAPATARMGAANRA